MSNTETENKSMKTVAVVMSTYNGGKNIQRQLDSIFHQKDVDVFCVIRDDDSSDNTVKVIEDYIRATGYKVFFIKGTNQGYAKSFWDALNYAGEADYYAFSDQDDLWKEDKLIKTITPMENSPYNGPKLCYCKMQRSDEDLHRLSEQVSILKPEVLTKKLCLTQTYNYGAATVFNKKAKELICQCWPEKSHDVPHDMWAGLLCYWFGKVFYVDEELYYWIRYGSSVTGEGTKKSGRWYRIRQSLQRKSYPNIAEVLVKNYKEYLTVEDMRFLTAIIEYKNSLRNRISLLFDTGFKRSTLGGTVMLKTGIMLGWF